MSICRNSFFSDIAIYTLRKIKKFTMFENKKLIIDHEEIKTETIKNKQITLYKNII